MDELDEFLWTRLFVGLFFGGLSGGRAECSFVVEAIEVAAGFLEVFDPAVRLYE